VLEASADGYGKGSVSLLSVATGIPADAISYYALRDRYGGFSIAGDYQCTAAREIYLYARGGNSGGDGSNAAIGLMALLGTCPKAGNFDATKPFVILNAVTTVAAAYAMAGGAVDATHVSDSAGSAESMAACFATVATGFTNPGLLRQQNGEETRCKIHTLANILSACINSNAPDSAGCRTLFANARGGSATGAAPGDTATAAIRVAQNPHVNVAALYGLQPRGSAPFTPALESAPSDFRLMPSQEAQSASTIAFASQVR